MESFSVNVQDWRMFNKLFYMHFCDLNDQCKTMWSKDFEINFYMKIIVTIIPTNLITNLLLLLFCPFLQTKNKNQIFSSLTKEFFSFVYIETHSTSKPLRIKKTFIKEFSHMLFLFVILYPEKRSLKGWTKKHESVFVAAICVKIFLVKTFLCFLCSETDFCFRVFKIIFFLKLLNQKQGLHFCIYPC